MIKGVTHAHLGPIWYHSEPSDVTYSQNQLLGTFSVASYSKTDLIRKFKVLGFKSQGKGKGTFPKKSCLPKMCFSKNWPPCNWLCIQNPAKGQ